ncbi:MAG: ABC transporter substrate-binding protein [Betaproteobacteria bacterium]|nr:ABC transporter substrate-binding protein [Betaproteobacteria bacterium]
MPLPIHRPIARRRLLIALAAGALAVPFVSLAQQQGKIRRIGFLAVRSRSTPSNRDPYYDAFAQAIRELGYVEGKNLVIEWRFADGKYERLPALAVELVQLNVEVIVSHSDTAVEALQRATSTIPIVTAAVADPVGSGIAVSLARPGGNITGLSNMMIDLSAKYIELLKLMMPRLSRAAVLVNPRAPAHYVILKGIQAAAQQLGIKLLPVDARTPEEVERGFAAMRRERADGVIILGSPFFFGQRRQITELAARIRLPSMFTNREEVQAGGLMSYGQNLADYFRRAASYVDKILKGAKPGDLPIEQPTRIHLAINRKTAKALGITIPQELLFRADEVIE